MNDVMILGAGGVGCVVGGHLSQKGHKVQLVNRSANTATAVLQHGLRLELDSGLQVSHPEAVRADEAKPARFIMCFTKTNQTAAALQSIMRVIKPDTIIVSMQNGLGNGALLADVTGCEVLHGVTMIPATVLAPAHVRSLGTHKSWLGPLNPASARQNELAKELSDMLTDAGIATDFVSEVSVKIWQKACFNVAMNGVSALADASPGLIGDTASLKAEVHALADEALTVAAALGIKVVSNQVHDLIDFACAEHRYHQPSMLQDIRASRQTEIGSLNDYIVQQAEAIAIDVPRNRLVSGLIHARQAANSFWKNRR